MSTPTTPVKPSFGTPESGTLKRQRSVVNAIFEALSAVDENGGPIVYEKFYQDIMNISIESDDLTPRKRAKVGLKVTQTSSLHDLMYVTSSLRLNYHDDEDHIWEEPVGPEVHLSNASGMLLLFLNV